jgi:hypothetical protein
VLAKLQANQKTPAPASERVASVKPTIVPAPVKSNASL